MPIVIRDGKRYRFSIPYSGERYQILRYSPAPDATGNISENDLMLILIDEEENISVENDEDEANELEALIESFDNGTIDAHQIGRAFSAIIEQMVAESHIRNNNEDQRVP